MVAVRGPNMFPAMVQGVVNQFHAPSGEHRIVLDTPPPYDALPLQVELARGEADSGLAEAVETAIKKQLGGTAKVSVLPPNSIQRSEGKSRRVIRTY
jgi:phenylacetate-CoA ligase